MSEVVTSQDSTKRPTYELRENGEIHLNRKGSSLLLAKYDRDTSILTFETFAIDVKHRGAIQRAVMEDAMTGELTGNAIKAYRIAGRPKDVKNPREPMRPKWDRMMGDKTPAYVRWLERWRPQAFYARYGVMLDSNGDPIRVHGRRVEQGLLDEAPTSGATQILGNGTDALSKNVVEEEEGYLATRQTCLTFTSKEVVNGEGMEIGDQEPDDEEPDDGDAGEPSEEKPKARGGRKSKGETEQEADAE